MNQKKIIINTKINNIECHNKFLIDNYELYILMLKFIYRFIYKFLKFFYNKISKF